jgi:hypothetical protein
MNKKKIVFGFATTLLLGIASTALASCGETKSSSSSSVIIDTEIASIAVKEGTLLGSFQQHYQVVDSVVFKDLVITTLNDQSQSVGEVSYSKAASSFSHTAINTDVLGESHFNLSYTTGGNVFTTLVSFQVINDVPNSWSSNANYAGWKASNTSVSDVKNSHATSFPFMKASKFYIGNQNEMSLFPVVIPESDDLSVAYVDTLSESDVSVKITSVATGNDVALTDVLENSAELRTKGLFKFKETVTGEYTMTFTYLDGTETDFPDLPYTFTVVKGYNINKPSDVFVLNNDDIDGNSGEGNQYFDGNDSKISAWKASKGIPTDFHANVGIFQTDISLGVNDIPTNYVFDYGRDGTDALLNNTLKDFAFILKHTFLTTDVEDKNFTVYGNFHQLSLANDFPMVTSIEQKMVEGHAALFGNVFQGNDAPDATTSIRNQYHTIIQDLKTVGDQGVSLNSDGYEAGVIFYKGFNDAEINNCVSTNFYTGIVICRSDNTQGFQSSITFNHTRMNNTYSSCIFNWNSAKIVVNDSEVFNAGGPLIFNQSAAWDYRNYNIGDSFENFSTPKPVTATLEIDGTSLVENWVVGGGGWFKQYAAEAALTNLKMVNQLFLQATAGSNSFLDNGFTNPTETGIGKINLIGLTMVNGSGITASAGAIFAKVTKDGKVIQDYDGGRQACLAGLAGGDISGLYTTSFGALSFLDTMYGASNMSMIFSNEDGSHFATLPSQAEMTSLDAVVQMNNGVTPTTTAVDDSFKTAKCLSLYMLGNHQGTDFTAGPTAYANYVGSNSFGMLLGTAQPA